jgi:hypothetical protein
VQLQYSVLSTVRVHGMRPRYAAGLKRIENDGMVKT